MMVTARPVANKVLPYTPLGYPILRTKYTPFTPVFQFPSFTANVTVECVIPPSPYRIGITHYTVAAGLEYRP